MTDDIQTLRDDIAYLKALADGGHGRSASGGAIMMGAGAFFGAASLVQWLAMRHSLAVDQAAASGGWLVATAAFAALLAIVKIRQRAAGSSPATAGYVWQGIGVGCFVLFVLIALATWRSQSPLLIQFAPSIIFLLYGAAWIAGGTAMRNGWFQLTGWASFAAAGLTAWLIGEPVSYLIYAAGLMLLAFAPGLVFVLKAQRTGE
jgi:hypothetical protein